jgi:hypothetical protein
MPSSEGLRLLARIIVLDSGPLGDACRKHGDHTVERLVLWLHQTRANGAIIALPEIADYEVRRGLLLSGATDGLERLDLLIKELRFYIPISTGMQSVPRAGSLVSEVRSLEPGAQPRSRRARSSRSVAGGAYDLRALRRRTP